MKIKLCSCRFEDAIDIERKMRRMRAACEQGRWKTGIREDKRFLIERSENKKVHET
jgi:hypothetical protein